MATEDRPDVHNPGAATAGAGRVDRGALLASNELFRHLNANELDALARYTRTEKYHAHGTIFSQGDTGTTMMAVVGGRVRISRSSAIGKEVVLRILVPGSVFGEIALLDGGMRSATATALEDTELIVLDRRDLIPFLERNPKVGIGMLVVLCRRLRRTSSQVEDSLFLPREVRLAKALLQLAEQFGKETPDGTLIDLPLSQRELGNFVGLRRETINKQLVEWRESGLISLHGGSITIRDLDAFGDVLERDY